MYARVLKMSLGPGARELATGMAKKADAVYRSMNGFVSVTYLIYDEAAGTYGSVSVWKTKADAEAAAEKLTPWLRDSYGDKLKAPPEVVTAEVFEP